VLFHCLERLCCACAQVVTCIPTRTLPRGMTLGAASNQEVEEIEKEMDEEEDAAAAAARRGQILWVRGLNRLQHQVIPRHFQFWFRFPVYIIIAQQMPLPLSISCSSKSR